VEVAVSGSSNAIEQNPPRIPKAGAGRLWFNNPVTREHGTFPLEPTVVLGDLLGGGTTDWEAIDSLASHWLGQPCLAVPSVRVGLGWSLESLGLSRHRDHVLVPRFLGRCILNHVNRHALAVEEPTSRTRMAIVVDQYGLRQDVVALRAEFNAHQWSFIEDSPYGVGENETLAPGSLARFIGLTKVLPVVQGGLLIANDERIARHVRARRQEVRRPAAWAVWTVMLTFRLRRYSPPHSALAEAAYELYNAIGGGNGTLRRNLRLAFEQIDAHTRQYAERMDAVTSALGEAGILPDLRRLCYVFPFLPGSIIDEARPVFRRCRFDDTLYHVDVRRNMLNPQYRQALLVPMNFRIPRQAFDALLNGLTTVLRSGRTGT
jgi:hypothetical protein